MLRRDRQLRFAAGATLAVGTGLAAPALAAAADFTVTTTDDDLAPPPGSLREAIQNANANAGPDRILFQSGLTGSIDLEINLGLSQGNRLIGSANTPGDARCALDESPGFLV